MSKSQLARLSRQVPDIAKLIQQRDELLAALSIFVGRFDFELGRHYPPSALMVKQARALIAKIEGEA